jgi:hypothetical protein
VSKKKLYISAPFELQASARILRDHLQSHGFEITATWLDEGLPNQPAQTQKEMADRDIRDIVRADALVLINPEDWKYKGTGGRHVEVGAVIMINEGVKDMPVFIYGVRSNVFHHDDCVLAVSPTVSHIVASLKEWRDRS